MWHLISIVITRLRNTWFWCQRNPFPAVLVVHAVFLIACSLRYISSITIQLRRKIGAVTILKSPYPHPHPVYASSVHFNKMTGTPKLVPPKAMSKKETTKNTKKLVQKTKQPVPKKESKKVKQPVVEKKTIKQTPKKEPEQKIITPIAQQQVQQPETPVVVPEIPAELHIGAPVGELMTNAQPAPGEVLHTRILEIWKPPRNVRPKSPCVLRVIVGKGILEAKPEIVTSSGSSAFDMSARRALLEIKYPQELWNRAITIHFS